MREFLFYIVILLTNIIQGITGFAGTILAMPVSLRLVGMDVAVPVLNLMGLLSGIYVFVGNRRHVVWSEIKKIVTVMGICVIAGILLRNVLSDAPRILYIILGTVVSLIAVAGLFKLFLKKPASSSDEERSTLKNVSGWILLVSAGLIHGMFVCGGPLLIGYLTGKIKDNAAFRATISTVWIFLNGIILLSQIAGGAYNLTLVRINAIAIPFLIAGMYIGGILYSKMSRRFFMILTYALLLISGLSLFFK